MKKLCHFICFLILTSSACAQNTINGLFDYSNMFSNYDLEIINTSIKKLKKNTGLNLVIFTVDSLYHNHEKNQGLLDSLKIQQNMESDKESLLFVISKYESVPIYRLPTYKKNLLTNNELIYIIYRSFKKNASVEEKSASIKRFIYRLNHLMLQYQDISKFNIVDTQNRIKLDHISLATNKEILILEKLKNAGFVVDSHPAIHTGQGTKGYFFNFKNFYLEILSVYNKEEIEQNVSKIDVASRLIETHSNLGIGLAQVGDKPDVLPFQNFRYKNKWMKGITSLQMSLDNINPKTPFIFTVSPSVRYKYGYYDKKDVTSNNSCKNITKIIIHSKEQGENINYLKRMKNIEIQADDTQMTEIELDNMEQKKTLDLSKELKLIIHY